MKCFWKRLLSLTLMMGLLLTSIPSVGALTGDETAPAAETASTDWKNLLTHSKPILPKEGTYAPDRLLVTRVNSGARAMPLSHESMISADTLFSLDVPQQAREATELGVEAPEKITCTAVNLSEGSDMLSVMKTLSEQPGVLSVEVDRLYTLDSVVEETAEEEPEPFAPDRDPLVAQQTWLELMGATKAWDMVTAEGTVPGEGVVVAVLDTGITTLHPDLKDQIAPGGRQFWLDAESNEVKSDGDYEDRAEHGTHVSGMIAGAKNGTGITGVAYGAKILPIKILGDEGSGHLSSVIVGMNYAAGLVDENGNETPDGEPRCDIANMSLGGNPSEPSPAYELAVAAMREAGVFLVVAAGNEETATSYVDPGNLYAPYCAPAYVAGAFAVMAMQETPRENGDYLASFSNWDSNPYAGTEYTLMAPGFKILSSVNEAKGWYAKYGGTSMATPATAGAAALVLSANPYYTAENLWSVLATSGQKRQGKTDQAGRTYDYHTLDVVAALNTDPDSVKSVVKGTVRGNWTEAPELDYLNDAVMVMPADGTYPEIKLTLRSYDSEAYKLSVTGAGLEPSKDVPYLAPGGEADVILTLSQIPTTNTFETEIVVTWINNDGSKGRETIPVSVEVIKAAPGEQLMDPKFGRDFYDDQKIELLWIFDKLVTVTLPTKPVNPDPASKDLAIEEIANKDLATEEVAAEEIVVEEPAAEEIILQEPAIEELAVEEPAAPEPGSYPLNYGAYYFTGDGSLAVKGSDDYDVLTFTGSYLFNPQISGEVNMMAVSVRAFDRPADEEKSVINITGGMTWCTIDDCDGLTLTVLEGINTTTIANSPGSTITAATIYNSTLMNNFAFHHPEDGSEPDNQIAEFIVTKLTNGDNGAKSIGFYENAVIGPAEVWYDEDVNNAENEPVLATAENCYYLPTAEKGDNDYNSWVLSKFNKLKCDTENSTVYEEGVDEEPRPWFLESCPIFLISTKRVPSVPAVKRDEHGEHLSYRLESEFSNHDKKGEFFGYYSYLWSDGNKLAEDIVWAEDGLSCTYTVYTSVENQKEDDIYALDDLGIPVQYDVCNLIHDRENKEIDIDDVTAKRVKNEQGVDEFVIAWNIKAKDYGELTGGELRCEILSTGEVLEPHTLTQEELEDGRAATPDSALPEGTQYKISAVLWDQKEDPGYKAEGETVYYEPYAILGDDIALEVNKLDTNGTLNLSGGETATLTLRAKKSFSMKNGLKITAFANKDALEITSVVPGIVAYSGIARVGDQTVIEIAPAGITKEKDYTDQYVFEDAVIATLTIGGKNVASEGEVLLHLQDFFGTDLKREDGTVFSFAIDTKTTVVSSGGGGGDYTPPKKDTNTTQTLPDGTLVTTTTNSDGSIQIVYKRPDGVSATVKNPAKKGEASTASISLPPTLAGASVKVPIPVAEGGITTVAVLVGADGKEQVIPGSFWKDGVLTVPLTDNATIIIRDNVKTFADVAADHWAADAVAFVTSRELFNGGDKGFLPADDMTRSMLVTVLARYDGQDTATGARWDSVGTDWAKERGISDGSGMEDVITREQLAVMLFRYAKAEKAEGDLAGFSDAAGVSPWAQDAMGWAVKTGIISGADGALNPQGNASRAEVAAMLARFVTTA